MINQKTDKRSKKEIVEEYKQKGADWLAERLYEARKLNNEIKLRCPTYRSHVDLSTRQMNNAAKVLTDNGIKPIRVIVEYISNKCYGCPVDECWEYEYCEREGDRHVSTCSFWCFDISKDGIYGILSDFEEFDEEVISVKTKDGQTLWQEDADEP